MELKIRSDAEMLRHIEHGTGFSSSSGLGVQLAREPTGELLPAPPVVTARLKRPRERQSTSRTDGTPEPDGSRPQRARPISATLGDSEPEMLSQSADSALADGQMIQMTSASLDDDSIPLGAEQVLGSGPPRALAAAAVLKGACGSPNLDDHAVFDSDEDLPPTHVVPNPRQHALNQAQSATADSSVTRAATSTGNAIPRTPSGASSSLVTVLPTHSMPSVGSAERRAGAALASAVQQTRRLAAEAGMRLPELQRPNEVAAAHQNWEAARRARIRGRVVSELALRQQQLELASHSQATATPFKPGLLFRSTLTVSGQGAALVGSGRAGLKSVMAMQQQRHHLSPNPAAVLSALSGGVAGGGDASQRRRPHPDSVRGVAATACLCAVLEQAARTLPAVSEEMAESAGSFAEYYRVSRRASESTEEVLEDMGYSRFRELQRRINGCNATGRITTSQFCGVLASVPVRPRSDAARRWRERKADAVGGMLMATAPMQQIVARRLAQAAAPGLA